MADSLPRKKLEKYIKSRRNIGIYIFCIAVIGDKIPLWLEIFIKNHIGTGDALIFPETGKSINQQGAAIDQLFNDPDNKIEYVVTRSAWIVTEFNRLAVFTVGDSKLEIPNFETFGASVNKINMCLFDHPATCGIRAERIMRRISKRVKLIKYPDKLDKIIDDEINLVLGESVEKTILLHTIFKKIDKLKESQNEKN